MQFTSKVNYSIVQMPSTVVQYRYLNEILETPSVKMHYTWMNNS